MTKGRKRKETSIIPVVISAGRSARLQFVLMASSTCFSCILIVGLLISFMLCIVGTLGIVFGTKFLKTEINKLIALVNKAQPDKILKSIFGEYNSVYIYGTVKTHKLNNPLRPIIFQTPTPIHETERQLHNLINPYLPAKYQINSTNEILDIIRVIQPRGILASLDVESLFTKVPVETTVDIIGETVHNQSTIPPLPSS